MKIIIKGYTGAPSFRPFTIKESDNVFPITSEDNQQLIIDQEILIGRLVLDCLKKSTGWIKVIDREKYSENDF